MLASLINTVKLHGIDPQAYLADVLDRIVSGRTKANALRELLPWNWQPEAGLGARQPVPVSATDRRCRSCRAPVARHEWWPVGDSRMAGRCVPL